MEKKKHKVTLFSDTSFFTCAFRRPFISNVPPEVSKNTFYFSNICFTAIGMHSGNSKLLAFEFTIS